MRKRKRSDSVLWQKPLYRQKYKKQCDNTQNATKNFDYTTIADDFLDVVLAFLISILQYTSKLLTQGYRYHKLREKFGKFFRSYSELLSKFGKL